MDPLRDIQLGADQPYGPLQGDFRYTLRTGYSTLVGPNNAGKSSLLQLLFRFLFNDPEFGAPAVCLIPSDRDYVIKTTETGTRTLVNWNQEIHSHLQYSPLAMAEGHVGPSRAELTRLLLHADLLAQAQRLNLLLPRFGLPELTIAGGGMVQFEEVVAEAQGSGLRGVLPILAAVTNDDVQALLIDEPELGLEPRLQKALRDVLVEAAETKRTLVVSTHSHLLLNRQTLESSQIVQRNDSRTMVETIEARDQLYSLVFDLLGSSTEDLFFPKNYVIVEGASDQVIVQRVLDLLGETAASIKVLSAQGVDEVREREISVVRALVPLIVNDSPYAGRVVALIDAPVDDQAANVQKLRVDLGERLFELGAPSVEEYLPEELYARAGRDKQGDRDSLHAAQGDLKQRRALKREISDAIAEVLTVDDLDSLPIIAAAARRAVEL